MAVIIVILIVGLAVANLGGQAIITSNLKQENRKSMEEAKRNHANWAKRTAQENDYYYDPTCKSLDTSFYSDGSVRFDQSTKKTYAKGEYMCDSRGFDCHWQKVGLEVKRPPSK